MTRCEPSKNNKLGDEAANDAVIHRICFVAREQGAQIIDRSDQRILCGLPTDDACQNRLHQIRECPVEQRVNAGHDQIRTTLSRAGQ